MISGPELIRRYAAGERDFSRLNLKGIQLYGSLKSLIDLRGANFRGVILEGRSSAMLSEAVLSDAETEGAIGLDLTMNVAPRISTQAADQPRQQPPAPAITFQTWLNELDFGYALGQEYRGYRYEPIQDRWGDNPLAAYLANADPEIPNPSCPDRSVQSHLPISDSMTLRSHSLGQETMTF